MPAWRLREDGIEIAVRVTPRAARDSFAAGTEEHFAARLTAHLPVRKDFDADGFTLALVCTMAGAVALSRAVTDPGFSVRILDSARAELQARLDRFES